MFTAPAFSPGPWITADPVEGRRRSRAFELLYEQCSDQSTPSMPSSTWSRAGAGAGPSSSCTSSAPTRAHRACRARPGWGQAPEQDLRALVRAVLRPEHTEHAELVLVGG